MVCQDVRVRLLQIAAQSRLASAWHRCQHKNNLLFCEIVPDVTADYYDLYNKNGELACLDGEEVLIDRIGKVTVTFRNDNGEESVYFYLTHEEADKAIYR